MADRQQTSGPIYVGPDRRQERRRRGHGGFEQLLRQFGLDRRQREDRRQQNSSWLLLSDKQQSEQKSA
jgi:hypothetical protein